MPHPVVEDFIKDSIDICELRRQGLLSKPCKIQGSIRWPKIATMLIEPTAIQITLINGQQQTFRISWAKCFANSVRPWLVCSSCSKRAARVYRAWAGYHCKHCCGLWHRSEASSHEKRYRMRLAKLCTAIDGKHRTITAPITIPQRPRLKHRRRYFRIRGAIADLQAKTFAIHQDGH